MYPSPTVSFSATIFPFVLASFFPVFSAAVDIKYVLISGGGQGIKIANTTYPGNFRRIGVLFASSRLCVKNFFAGSEITAESRPIYRRVHAKSRRRKGDKKE